jgi:DNA helicase-2/ATP-dependent DNA helicase PcrA
MKERVIKLLENSPDEIKPSWIGTFHSVSTRILRIEASNVGIERNFVIYDTDDSEKLIREILSEMDISVKDFTPSSVLGAISKAKSEMVDANAYAAESRGSYFYERVSKIYPAYQKRLRENLAMDFSDLLFEVVRLFENYPNVLNRYQSKFRHILVDEYQDTNRVQYRFIRLLKGFDQARGSTLTVVGDVSQSIYSWRGADYKNMLQFEKDYPDAKIFQLAKNYRSTQNILDAAMKVIANNRTHMKIDLYTENPLGNPIKLFEAEHERTEAGYVADMVAFSAHEKANPENISDNEYNEVAVLYRTNAQSRVIEEAFINAGIPYKIIGGVRFYDRKEIKDALAYLRVFHNPKDTVSWARCINTPTRGIGKKTLDKISQSGFDVDLIEDLTHVRWKKYIENASNQTMAPIQLLDAVLKDFKYLEYLNDGTEDSLSRIENLKELRSVAKQYNSLEEFLENVALVESSNKGIIENNSVTLMTLHAAKGLEFETVFIVGMEEGIFPHSRALADQNELEEERRLCYVGITRAKKNLYMTYTRHRTFFGQTSSSIASRFITEIPEELLDFNFA